MLNKIDNWVILPADGLTQQQIVPGLGKLYMISMEPPVEAVPDNVEHLCGSKQTPTRVWGRPQPWPRGERGERERRPRLRGEEPRSGLTQHLGGETARTDRSAGGERRRGGRELGGGVEHGDVRGLRAPIRADRGGYRGDGGVAVASWRRREVDPPRATAPDTGEPWRGGSTVPGGGERGPNLRGPRDAQQGGRERV